MKQRIRVVAMIQQEGETLIMKKSQGRSDSAPMWELPTGKIKFGEQPEEAIERTLEEYLGVELTKKTLLHDVVTFMSQNPGVGSSQLSNLYIVYNVWLNEGAKIKAKERYSAYKYIKPEEMGNYRLDEASAIVLGMESRNYARANYKEVANSATVYVDGSSRGNPGPSGIGYHIVGENGQVLRQGGEFIGFASSRIAEYYALKEGCEQAIELGLKTVRFVSDNLMMVNQMNGIYKVKNRDLLPIYDDIQRMLENFEACAFMHVAREQNQEADAQANLAIDRQFAE
jgi:ribonuclease HI/ADP-ribose pyrophosphatase YjhB (NUDIX family)